MSEVLAASVSPANIIITALAIFVVIYWITVIIGVLDIELFDFDLDTDGDFDGASVLWLNNVLAFFNLGQVPVMIFLTFLIIPSWTMTMIVNDLIGNSSFIIGIPIVFGSLFVGLFIAKFMTTPFVKIFGKLNSSGDSGDVLIGKVCTITIPASSNKTGQAKVSTKGAPHLLNVRTTTDMLLKTGETGLVLEFIKETNTYLIEPYN
ncbi:OB-fold-containig protein [Marinigracilibium pacificum]|uniref:YqiJ family protein n=1 Tax=Marinigracilibium pacificum TaxID=2729599 RepID=A0A848IS76_9BACT|nr:OB-fold-containig protein [Marinigracilibium pacificum]NMM47303.1 YqiJ family protein [Marinigracilibium pacificum]